MAYSSNTTIASGLTAEVSVPFLYLKQSEIHVSLDGTQVADADLTWLSSSTIQLPSTPSAGVVIKVWRETGITAPIATFAAGTLDHRVLNRQVLQLLYLAQETFDVAELSQEVATAIIDTYNQIVALSEEVETQANIVSSIAANALFFATNDFGLIADLATDTFDLGTLV